MSLLWQEQNCLKGISKNCNPWTSSSAEVQGMRKRIHSQEEEIEMLFKERRWRILEELVL